MTLSFAWITIAEARAAGLDDMLALHWEEIEDHKDVSPFDPNWPAYVNLERLGQLKVGALRRGGEMIGYNIFFLYPPLHHRSTVWAISDVLYLDPEHRRGWAGVKLIKEAEAGLKAMGARVILYGVKEDRNLSRSRSHDSVGQLLSKLGYASFDRSWSKAL